MPTNALWLKMEGTSIVPSLQMAVEKLNSADGEIVLDFSTVRHIDVSVLQALEKLAGVADDKTVKVALCGVNVDIYKVLKLMKLTPRFSFMN